MPAKAKKNCPCRVADCVCTSAICDHMCCIVKRDRIRKTELAALSSARNLIAPGTPGHRDITRKMVVRGFVEEGIADLSSEFAAAVEPGAVATLSSGMQRQIDSQEQEHELSRLMASLPRLESSNSVDLAMTFF